MKTQKIAYWIATGILMFMMAASGVMHLIHQPMIEGGMKSLGYPPYVSTLLGTLKLLGVVALLVPGYPRLKEWAYAGFAFDLIGAAWSHFSSGQSILPPVIVAIPYIASYALYLTRGQGWPSLSASGAKVTA